ncbi:MAG: hypothetical protein H7331_05890 [Bacteroidia bacterium]|nr:hypothetical protein [Bacteroidia bacterium]
MSKNKTTFFYLSTCTTCTKIMAQLNLPKDVIIREIKSVNITQEELTEMHALAGSYESLFSRKAMKYRSLGLDKMELTEADYKKYILMEYTFLKRPVLITNNSIHIGNAGATIKAGYEALHGK